jgi:hypothetical protein
VEDAMTGGDDQLADAVREAMREGEIAAPSELITLIAGLESPLKALQDMDKTNELLAAFNNQFGFINSARFAKRPVQAADMARYASMVRWLIHELRHWRRTKDIHCGGLVAAFVAAQVCDSENKLWELLPDDIGDNVDLTEYLKDLVASFAVEFNARAGATVPTWESEAVEKFKQADVEGDWVGIMDGWKLFWQPFFANTLQTQAVRLLYRYCVDRLVQGLANLRQTPVAIQVADVLTVEQRLRLALASDNPYVQLASAYQTLTGGQRRPEKLGSSEQHLLTELLLKVANDASRWVAWMQVFNTYPVRFPALQTPLGRALARASDNAMAAYVDSIWLYPKQTKPAAGRQYVSECLREFHAHALPERRRELWTLALKRWLVWNFNQADPNQHLFEIHWSDLDYAVVAYACECMDDPGRKAALDQIRQEMRTLEDSWHVSITDIVTAWNRLLSKFQPYARAASVVDSNEDLLTENQTYWPFDQSQNQYVMMKFRMI